MKFIIFLFLLFSLTINASEFYYKNVGTLTINKVTKFPSRGKFIAFKHSGGFEIDIGKYGKYQCNGSILYNKESSLENMHFAYEFKDQNGDFFIGMGKRLKGSDIDRAVGYTEIVDGQGFWEDFIGYKCSYAVEYIDDIVFSSVKCKNNNLILN